MKKALSLLVALAMLAATIPAVMAADELPEDGLIAYLSFDEGVTAEIGGVTVKGSVTIAEGLDGNAASIPSGAGNYLFITDADGSNNLLVGKNAVTISFFENRTGERWPVFIAPNTNAQAYNSSENYIGLYDSDAFRLERYVGTRGSANSSVVRGDIVNGWKHIAIVLTDTYSELFVNGVSVGKENSASTLAQLFPTASYFQVGRGNWGNGEDFVGLIDELRVYDRALSDDEIAALAAFPITIEEVLAVIDIADKDITEDIELVTEYKGATISWSSSDAAVISNSGKLGETAVDKTVTLTATITLPNGTVATQDYELTVKANVDEEAFLKALEIADADNILDSIYLPTEVYGVEVKWTSSNTDVITDEDMPNPDSEGYVIPAGNVTRGDSDVKVTLSATYMQGSQTFQQDYEVTVKAAKEEEEKVAYLYAYFRGNVNGSNEHLSIHVATSEDGYNWTDLNGNWPILESTMGTKGLRDPYIIRSRYGDKFYLLATDLDTQDGQGWGPWSLAGSKYLMVWESEDLVNWSEQRMVKFANDDIGCAWAPEAVYDVDTDEYLVYASGKDLKLYRESGTQLDTVYVVRTRDFRSFSEPEMFFLAQDDNGNRVNAIDSTIIRADDGKYYHFYKKFNSQVWMMVGDHAAGPYTEVRSFSPIGGEGPAIYKDNNSDKYVLCIDDYSKYVPYITDDIASGIFTKGTGEVTMSTGSKHGGMIPITQKEYDGLLAAYGAKPDVPGEPVLSYDFESETEGLMGNAAIVEDEERGKVLSLDGSADTYFEFPEGTFDRRDTFTLIMDVKSNMTGNFFTFALGAGDGTDHYMFFRARNNQLNMAGTVAGWEYEQKATVDNIGLTGEWARIALVVKPGYYAIYKDGALVAENDNVTVTKLSKEQGGGSLLTTSHLGLEGLKAYLGKSFFPGDAYMTGSFDNVDLYYRALDAGEIMQDVNPGVTDEEILANDIETVKVPEVTRTDIELPTTGAYGSTIVWESSDESVLAADGKVTRPSLAEGDKTVTLTATYTYGDATETKTYTVVVKAADSVWVSTADWSSHDFDAVTDKAYIDFDVISNEANNGLIGITASDASFNAWGAQNICIQLMTDNLFRAHNGSAWTYTNAVRYEPDKYYHFSILADVKAQTFSIWVTDEAGNETLLADKFPYRSKNGTNLAKAIVRGGDQVAAGLFTVENFVVTTAPNAEAVLGWDGEDFTINFTVAKAEAIAVYSETDKETNIGAELADGEKGLALSTADSNRRYQAAATYGELTGAATAPVSVYSLVAQAVVDFAYDGQIEAKQLEKTKAVLNKGGVYMTKNADGEKELTPESAKLMDIDGDTVKLNEKAVKAGLRFESVKYAIADGEAKAAAVSEDGTYVTIEGLSAMEASVIYLEDVEFTLDIVDETVADETVSGELDFIEEI